VVPLPHHLLVPGNQHFSWADKKDSLQKLATGQAQWEALSGQGFPSYPIALVSDIVPFVASSALELETLFPSPSSEQLHALTTHSEGTVVFTQREIASLLAHGFFGLLTSPPDMDGQCLNLSQWGQQEAKLHCLVSYFSRCRERVANDPSWRGSNVSFSRRTLDTDFSDLLVNSRQPLSAVTVSQASIEEIPLALHADFANEYIGGGVLRWGAVQEEIRFSICPECLVAILLCEAMADKEAILIRGAEQYCKYTGYGRSFRFAGEHQDETPVDGDNYVRGYGRCSLRQRLSGWSRARQEEESAPSVPVWTHESRAGEVLCCHCTVEL